MKMTLVWKDCTWLGFKSEKGSQSIQGDMGEKETNSITYVEGQYQAHGKTGLDDNVEDIGKKGIL